jgi:AAA domain
MAVNPKLAAIKKMLIDGDLNSAEVQRLIDESKPKSACPPLVVLTTSELKARRFKPREPLMVTKSGHAVFHQASLNEIHAWRGVGKTNFGIGLANALAHGTGFLAWKAPLGAEGKLRQFRVGYVEGELPGTELQERFSDFAQESEHLMVVTPEGQEDCILPSLATAEGRAFIEEVIVRCKLAVLFLDSISSLANISTNDEEAWLDISAWLKVLRNKYGVAVFYMHHDGKGLSQRGHSKHEDLLDKGVHLYWKDGITSTDGIDHLKCTLKFDKARQPVREDSHLDIEIIADEFGRQIWAWSNSKPKSENKTGRKERSDKAEKLPIIQKLKNEGETWDEISKKVDVPVETMRDWIRKEKELNETESQMNCDFVGAEQ